MRRAAPRQALAVLVPAVLAAGCSAPPDEPEPQSLEDGHGNRVVVEGSGELRLERGDAVLARIPPDGLVVGTVPEIEETLSYDPYFLEDVEQGIYRPPFGLAWLEPTGASPWAEGDAVGLALEYEDEDGARREGASLAVRVSGPGRFELRFELPEGAPPAVYARLRFAVDEEEHYYGLGEVFDHVDHRGRVRAMQIEPLGVESANNEAHVPIPLLIGTGGWGLYVDSRRPGVFDVAADEPDVVEVTYGLGEAAADGLHAFLAAEEHPLDVTRHYYELTGFPGPVAPWALGPLIWRDEVDGQEAVEEDLATIRDLDLATTGYWIDRPYASAVNAFDFDAERYSDPAAMMATARDLGFRVALWHTPYVDPEDEDSLPLFEHAEAEGFFPPRASTPAPQWGPPIDFTNPDAYAWWQGLLGDYRELGVSGYKLDYAEEVLVGVFGLRAEWRFHDGSDELTMHRGYQLLYHQVYAEMLPEEGGLLLCRAAVAGDQVNGTIIWPGDIDAALVRFGEEATDAAGESYVAVGGLPAAVVAGSSLGPSGFPLFGSDTGGYRHTPPDRETYIRWFEQTALSTVMQVGTNSNDLPWDLGEIGLDPEVLDLYRLYARLHLRLFPYLWTYLQRVQVDGRAIQRPLGLACPEIGEHPEDVYLLGDHLLVAPVVERGVVERDVPLPPGPWQGFWSGEVHAGPRATLEAPLETQPLLVRLWAPIPMLRPTIDCLEPVADEAAIDSFATSPDPLWVRVGVDPDADEPGGGELALYDGTTLTTAASPSGSGCVDLEVELGAGSVWDGPFVVELVGGTLDSAVAREGARDEPIDEAADQDAFDAAESAWLAVEPGRTLVKLGAVVLAATLCE